MVVQAWIPDLEKRNSHAGLSMEAALRTGNRSEDVLVLLR